ncbi:hypothetical protein [Thalassococcus lentus]|uniref:Uncharacterized protein n=1 Tax=Thalassococcus lentus TaxID=1210524 RepID=A0ABT4XU86_9RHOB|nr:hypothetical protein [Thalassococcus lentus]MDA7425420.1 hypothetical protein [Thalassococcus lentus]
MTGTAESLIYVVRQSKAQIADLSARLDSARGKQVEPILRALGKEADVCSAALSKLARLYVDVLPDTEDKMNGGVPDHDPDLLLTAQLLFRANQNGFCPRCGGIK